MRSSYFALTHLFPLVALDLGAFAFASASPREREVPGDPAVPGRHVASSSSSDDPDSYWYPRRGDDDVHVDPWTTMTTTGRGDVYDDFDFFDVYGFAKDDEKEGFGDYDEEGELEDLSLFFPGGQEGDDEGFPIMTAKEEQRLRYLQITNSGGIPTFNPLTCNDNIAEAVCTTNKLSEKVNETLNGAVVNELVIPCGECWYWDYDNTATIPPFAGRGGINIIGKLHVPSTAHGMLTLPHVVVQGVLQIDPPAAGNEVKLLMFTKQDTVTDNWLDVFFHPHTQNAQVCDATNGCKIGKKAIAVAGGTLDIRGIDQAAGCPSWVKLEDLTDADRKIIDVGSAAASCWNVGDEILLTSPLMGYEFRFNTTIESINATSGLLSLVDSLPEYYKEATCAADPDFCVEVASLSRRVVFEAVDDDPTNDYKVGGHLIVLLTRDVAQTVEGVELRNFGQQGLLGRYPIHFHMCGNVAGSLVFKNVIRDSNQRCVVIHGSDDVHIYDNVAFETHGHCYFTEDGVETGNVFERNLGASTMKPDFIIDGENDNKPSTFWITNTQNHWIGNVAAGSDDTGIWFDTRTKVRGPSYDGNEDYQPIYLPLGTFKDNVAHSNKGGIRTYSPGYKPEVEAVFENTKTYRNKNEGWFVHGNRNIAFIGGIVADNKRGILNFRASNLRFENMTIVGYSEAYKRVRSLQPEAHLCVGSATNWMIGMYIHPWRNIPHMGTRWGAAIKDVVFRRLGPIETGCTNDVTGAIVVSKNQVQHHHDCPNRLEGIVFEGGTKKIDACDADSYPVENLCIEDVDGSVGGAQGFFVTDHPPMTTFARGNGEPCAPVPNSCLVFCEGACLRQVTFKVSNAFSTESVEMVISKGIDSVVVPWMQFDTKKPDNTRVKSDNDGRFGATVPAGNYDISFRYVGTEEPAWPDYVFVEYEEPPACDATLKPSINLMRPPATAARCPPELVRDGDFEGGLFGAWQQKSAVLEITTAWGSSNALRVTKKSKLQEGASQSVDVTCLVEGFMYVLTADIRIEHNKNAGEEIFCEPSAGDCPIANLTFFYWDVALKMATTTNITIATVISADQVDNWYKMQGSHTLTALEATADRVELTFESPETYNHIIDNVSLRTDNVHTTPDPTTSPTSNPTTSPTSEPSSNPSGAAPPPTYNKFETTADVSIRSGKRSGDTYGNKNTLQVMDETYERRVLLKFNLTQSVPPGAASSVDARLRLYVYNMKNDPYRTIEVRRVSEEPSWDEYQVTWDTYHADEPAVVHTGMHPLNITLSDVGTVVEFDISDIVAGRVAEGGGALVLQLVTVYDTTTNINRCVFRSKEGASAEEPGPTLVVSTGGGVAGDRRFMRRNLQASVPSE